MLKLRSRQEVKAIQNRATKLLSAMMYDESLDTVTLRDHNLNAIALVLDTFAQSAETMYRKNRVEYWQDIIALFQDMVNDIKKNPSDPVGFFDGTKH